MPIPLPVQTQNLPSMYSMLLTYIRGAISITSVCVTSPVAESTRMWCRLRSVLSI